jgi:hypothetical protein
MTDKQLRGIYGMACSGKGYDPNEGQFKLWKQLLGWHEEADLAQALLWYFEQNTTFPMPAELKTLAGQAKRAREGNRSVKKYLVMYQCPLCLMTASEWLPMGENPMRICNSIYTLDKDEKRIGLPANDRCPSDLSIGIDERMTA